MSARWVKYITYEGFEFKVFTNRSVKDLQKALKRGARIKVDGGKHASHYLIYANQVVFMDVDGKRFIGPHRLTDI